MDPITSCPGHPNGFVPKRGGVLRSKINEARPKHAELRSKREKSILVEDQGSGSNAKPHFLPWDLHGLKMQKEKVNQTPFFPNGGI